MTRKIIISACLAALLLAAWYLLLKPYDYQIIINANTSKGTCFQSVLNWSESLQKKRGITSSITHKEPFKTLDQSMELANHDLDLEWRFETRKDSAAVINLNIKNNTNTLSERIKKVFGTSELQKEINKEITEFNTGLVKHLDEFKVHINGIETSPEAYVAYVPIKSNQKDKAGHMIWNSAFINTFLKTNNIKLQSNPFLEVTTWDVNSTDLTFNFCFPIIKTDSLPDHEEIRYKQVNGKSSIKATFNGNYSMSDRAWFGAHQYAEENNIKIKPALIEIFYNNPHLGEDEMSWKSEAFIEIDNNN
jgi:effector-binding domain-containing protein